MEDQAGSIEADDARLANRLRELRQAKRWSLDELAARSGVSRASLSRIENAEVSPTAAVLGRLAHAHGTTMSRLLADAEDEAQALVARADQREWIDPETGFRRRFVSPPATGFACEVLECELPVGVRIDYPLPPRAGLEHHVYLVGGELELTVEGAAYRLRPGDCLRYRLNGASRFHSAGRGPARYLLVIR
jgi:transcriptional regulator with XRE-family HTH domain